jgi:hypothetical protein
MLSALLAEPPFRRVIQLAARMLPVSIQTKDLWNAADRPHYLAGVLYAAQQAQREGRDSIAVIEFGVAQGDGLVALQSIAEAVERATRTRITVYGFDTSRGMPAGTGDYRDHPDVWQAGDYPMDVDALRGRLTARTHLVLGHIQETIFRYWVNEPVGFVAIDVDLYSSARDALSVLAEPRIQRLRRVAIYLDDSDEHYNHRWAGELLAVDEFNAASETVKIDRWRGLRVGRAFPDAPWIEQMWLAHDLAAISQTRLRRGPARMSYCPTDTSSSRRPASASSALPWSTAR